MATKFKKELFSKDGDYLMYYPNGIWTEPRQFVARFKYGRGGAGSFKSFLIKNFTVEEYFARRDAGESPLPILESKGYISDTVKRVLKSEGYTPNAAGREQKRADQAAGRKCPTVLKREEADRLMEEAFAKRMEVVNG